PCSLCISTPPATTQIYTLSLHDALPISHLEKMYRFWQTVLLGEHTYYGSPLAPHIKLPVQGTHFDRWKQLFMETVDENFTGEKAAEAKFRAEKMAEMFQLKIEYFKHIE